MRQSCYGVMERHPVRNSLMNGGGGPFQLKSFMSGVILTPTPQFCYSPGHANYSQHHPNHHFGAPHHLNFVAAKRCWFGRCFWRLQQYLLNKARRGQNPLPRDHRACSAFLCHRSCKPADPITRTVCVCAFLRRLVSVFRTSWLP